MFNKDHSDVASWTVLIVDDEPDNVGVPEGILTFYGADVHSAENGVKGLELLQTVTPTLILLDLSMPEMDGWEMLQALRKHHDWKDLCVIALTAHAMTGDREKVMEAGFDGYISKPIDLMTFIDEIKKIQADHTRSSTEN